METIENNEDLLSLTLGLPIVTLKRKRNDVVCKTSLLVTSEKDYEGKITRLIEERREMLNANTKGSGKGLTREGSGLHLIHLLLVSATLINESNVSSAIDNLTELYRYVSIIGDSGQRVAAYFTDGLSARLVTRKSEHYSTVMCRPNASEEFTSFTNFYRVLPFYQFAHFTANQIILEAFEKDEGKNHGLLQVIDFDVSYGFQWPSLIQSLSEKSSLLNNSLSLRLTGIGNNVKELSDTENRLVSFSKGFRNIEFEFRGLLRGSEVKNLQKRDKNETIAVNLVFHLSNLSDILKISDILTDVHSLSPSVIILAEREGSRNNCGVLSSYVNALHYYAAMFDSLDDCLPLVSVERMSIERDYLGREIKEVVALDCSRFEVFETWKERMENHGFVGMKLSSKVNIQGKLLLKMGSHYQARFEGENGGGGFRVYERDEGKAISLGWQDRILVNVSSWCSR